MSFSYINFILGRKFRKSQSAATPGPQNPNHLHSIQLPCPAKVLQIAHSYAVLFGQALCKVLAVKYSWQYLTAASGTSSAKECVFVNLTENRSLKFRKHLSSPSKQCVNYQPLNLTDSLLLAIGGPLNVSVRIFELLEALRRFALRGHVVTIHCSQKKISIGSLVASLTNPTATWMSYFLFFAYFFLSAV